MTAKGKAASVAELEEEAKRNGTELISDSELAEKLSEMGVPSDSEIAEKLNELGLIQRTPEEIAEKKRIETYIEFAENRIAEIKKEQRKLYDQFSRYLYGDVPSKAVEKYETLKREAKDLQRAISQAEADVRNISPTRAANAEAVNSWKWDIFACKNKITALEKQMKETEAN